MASSPRPSVAESVALRDSPRVFHRLRSTWPSTSNEKRALNKLRARDALPTRQLRKFERLEEEQKTLIARDARIMDSTAEAGCLEITPLIARTEELKRLRAKETLSPREARRLERLERLEQEASDAE